MIECSQNVSLTGKKIKIATFNVSFGRDTFEELVAQMHITAKQQTKLVSNYLNKTSNNKITAENIIQIRNVAAIIQINRPDVLMLCEFNNDGFGKNNQALIGFQKNYLSVSQSIDGAGGKANLTPIKYPYFISFPSNTGLLSEFDLDNDGVKGQLPGDAWGYGVYHGQYAFALLSKYEIDTKHIRSFQHFKWKDMEGASIPCITLCHEPKKFPLNMKCGDFWYTQEKWQQVRLSSKNHVDVPIIIGNDPVHLLMSHPTPPIFDLGKNKQQNAAEVQFWHDYMQGKDYFYDDLGNKGGLAKGAKFILIGDQNLDPFAGDGISEIMRKLHADPLINQRVMNGSLFPISRGGSEYAAKRKLRHPMPKRITSTFGLTVDYVIPSAELNVVDTRVYWPASYQKGRKLMQDRRIGNYGTGKDISSDHRMVWIIIRV